MEVIAPVTDPESGTVRVQLRLENGDRKHRSGNAAAWSCPPSHGGGRNTPSCVPARQHRSPPVSTTTTESSLPGCCLHWRPSPSRVQAVGRRFSGRWSPAEPGGDEFGKRTGSRAGRAPALLAAGRASAVFRLVQREGQRTLLDQFTATDSISPALPAAAFAGAAQAAVAQGRAVQFGLRGEGGRRSWPSRRWPLRTDARRGWRGMGSPRRPAPMCGAGGPTGGDLPRPNRTVGGPTVGGHSGVAGRCAGGTGIAVAAGRNLGAGIRAAAAVVAGVPVGPSTGDRLVAPPGKAVSAAGAVGSADVRPAHGHLSSLRVGAQRIAAAHRLPRLVGGRCHGASRHEGVGPPGHSDRQSDGDRSAPCGRRAARRSLARSGPRFTSQPHRPGTIPRGGLASPGGLPHADSPRGTGPPAACRARRCCPAGAGGGARSRRPC